MAVVKFSPYTIALGGGALALVFSAIFSLTNKFGNAINEAHSNSQKIVIVQAEIRELKKQLAVKTKDRYTSRQAKDDLLLIYNRLEIIERQLDEVSKK